MYSIKIIIVKIIFAFLFNLYLSDGLHLTGKWNTSEFYKFLVKFGFQQTDKDDAGTRGYIYGNITSSSPYTHEIAFVVLDSEYFIRFFKNRTALGNTCSLMFERINDVAWDRDCNRQGTDDMIRYVPCKKNELCRDELPEIVVPNSQFTFQVQDRVQPRYWYVSLVNCHRNLTGKSCEWVGKENLPVMELHYDLWFVNGKPDSKSSNFFEHQFSIEHFDILELYLVFFILYIFLIPVQCYALVIKQHIVALLLFACLLLEFSGILFNFIHFMKFANDGIGVERLETVGMFFDLLAQSSFMLLLLLVVKGMGISCVKLPLTRLIFVVTIWLAYTIANVALFIWNLMEVEFIADVDEWQTWPGFLILTFRICIMLWFLWELRSTFLADFGFMKSRFYLHFGAGFLVWFIYLPLVAIICSQISSFWRNKTLLSMCYSADFLSFCVTIHLLWPTQKYLIFNTQGSKIMNFRKSRSHSKGYTSNFWLPDDDDDCDEFE